MKILVLEDELSIRDFVRINLKRQSYEVVEASTGEEALALAMMDREIDIALLDVMLPGMDGFAVCKELRHHYPRMGIIMLTAKGQEQDKVIGLEAGADDYVVKPFSPLELVARVKALYRRMHPDDGDLKQKLVVDPFTILLDERRLFKAGQEIELTPKEFELISLLMQQMNKAVSRDEILTAVWGKYYVGDLKIVDVNIRRIRQKIEADASRPKHLETVWGYGYLWRKEQADEGT